MSACASDPIRYAPVTRPYRRWLALSLALLLHLAVIGAVGGWQFAAPPAPRSTLDVVLVTRPAESPVDADAIAEADQQAAGEPDEAVPAESLAAPLEELPMVQESASEVAPVETEARPDEPAPPEAESEPPGEALPEPRESAPQAAGAAAPPSDTVPSASGRDLLAQATRSIREQGLSQESPGPADDEPRQAAQRAAEARYIDDWTRRVEEYGNRVHPAPRHLQGQLRIRVVIGRDGELRQAEVVQSSGHAELDQAALDTVRGATPYRPFDAGMGSLDSLSITRVWRFGQGNHYGVR